MIDVSQSVEHAHPHALEFLRKDISNINDFFEKKGVTPLQAREFFEFVTDPTIDSTRLKEHLDTLYASSLAKRSQAVTSTQKAEQEVWCCNRAVFSVAHY